MPRYKIIKKDKTEFDFHAHSPMLDKSAQLAISPKILFDTNIIKANQDDGGLEVGERFLKLRGVSLKATFDSSVTRYGAQDIGPDLLLNNLIDAVFKIDYFVDIKAGRRIKCAPDKNLGIKSKAGAGKRFGEIDIKLLALDALWEAETATTGGVTTPIAMAPNTENSFTPTIGGFANTGMIYRFTLAAGAATVQNGTILIRDNNQTRHIGLTIPSLSNSQTLEIDMENGGIYIYTTGNSNKGARQNNLLTRNSNFFYSESGLQNIEINQNFAANMAYEFREKFFV